MVTVQLLGSGDAFGGGGRFQTYVPGTEPYAVRLELGPEMLAQAGAVPCETAEDGKLFEL